MGEVFAGRFELVDVLGRGGMGDVWRVWDRRDATYRAAKLLRQSDSVSLLRFIRESSWRIEHPHVVVPLGWTGEDDRVLFTMPIVEGGSLATVLADYGTVPWSWARVVLDHVLDALDAVHAAGLVHRDVKPANILLRATGAGEPYALLSDFGIAWHRDEPRLTRAAESVGTRGYQAPEIGAGAEPHPSQDLYAVGVLARELLGQVPAGSVLEALVDPDPQRRPASAAEARAAVAALDLDHDPHDEPVEVFDHVPSLPGGWGASGPARAARAARSTPSLPKVSKDVAVAGVLAVVGVLLLVAAVVSL